MTTREDVSNDSRKNNSWKEILAYERTEIERGRSEAGIARNQDDRGKMDSPGKPNTLSDLTGLAFSGGGIRSATFNLGVIQALAELRMLKKFDYLSTVSGGGYIGSWLSSWMSSHDQTDPEINKTSALLSAQPAKSTFINQIVSKAQRIWESHEKTDDKRRSISEVENELAPENDRGKPVLASGDSEPLALRHLRSYTDFLKPRGGLFSLDAMTAFTTWLRNSLLNQLILISVFAALLLIPLGTASFIKNIIYVPSVLDSNMIYVEGIIPFSDHSMLWFMTSACLACAIGFININILYKPALKNPEIPWYSSQKAVFFLILLPLVLCSFFLTVMLPSLYQLIVENGYINVIKATYQFSLWPLTPSAMLYWMLIFCGVAFIASSPLRLFFFESANRRASSFFYYGLIFIVAALLGFILLTKIAAFLVAYTPTPFSSAVIANILTFGPPLILGTFALAVFVYVGLLGNQLDEHQREWWSHLVAMVAFASLCWLLIFTLSIWGSLAVDYLKIGFFSLIAWLATSGVGAALGKNASVSSTQESKGANKWLSIVAQFTPYIFIFGLCLLVAYLLNVALMNLKDGIDISKVELTEDAGLFNTTYYLRLSQFEHIFSISWWYLLFSSVLLFCLGALFSWRVDINAFSFHNFYRNRLTRAYLAAGIADKERDKTKLPLTGMNDMDSPRLDRLPSRPYHILNTALNITSGKHLSWQERKAASFFFSKGYCGYFLQGGNQEDNYCKTANYLDRKGFMSLNLPMTISGAAASPNGGYHTSLPLAFLMTVFNVRLGWWMQNTAKESYWQSRGPSLGLKYLFKELFANVDENSPFVYLSDGGHFENLGIYELVRRECKIIVVCDAGADPNYEFEDLGNAIRKCYIDLGVRIEINTEDIKPAQMGRNKGRSELNHAIGKILYKGSNETGLLLYIKASMCKNEATDIEHYKSTHQEFPHDPTADQSFTESQFESYRKLGYTIGHRLFDYILNNENKEAETNDELKNLKKFFYS